MASLVARRAVAGAVGVGNSPAHRMGMRTFTVDGRTVAYLDVSEGPAVIRLAVY